jgi:hypothetical protein
LEAAFRALGRRLVVATVPLNAQSDGDRPLPRRRSGKTSRRGRPRRGRPRRRRRHRSTDR